MTLAGDTPKLRHLLADWYALGDLERVLLVKIARQIRQEQEHYGKLSEADGFSRIGASKGGDADAL